MRNLRPKRLNLAIGRRCFVVCAGCYTRFGGAEPDHGLMARTVGAFARLGLRDVTVSGGDPLTIRGLFGLLRDLRAAGARSIKVDTVGTSLVRGEQRVEDLAGAADYIGIPLDGWSNASVSTFRAGRPALFNETRALLEAFDALGAEPNVIINTVAHRGNAASLKLILGEVLRHRSVCQWNVFQYTPTDQAGAGLNEAMHVDDEQFAAARDALWAALDGVGPWEAGLAVELRSVRARLGEYLLINSDGDTWLPDELGNTIRLGRVFGREAEVLTRWSAAAEAVRARAGAPPPVEPWRYVLRGAAVEDLACCF